MLKRLPAALGLFVLCGCTTEPAPTLPPGDVPARFEGVPASAPIWPKPDWWKDFGDPQLTALIADGEAHNLDIAQAAARLRQADARAIQAGASLLPTVAFNPNIGSFYGQARGNSAQETDWTAEFGASYELDFWGKNRDALESATQLKNASAADRATVALTVTAAIADTYFQLLSLRQRILVAEANLKASEDILNLVQRRVNAGYAPPSDLTQERANMDAQRAVLPPLQLQERQALDALAVLVGRPPQGFEVRGDSLNEIKFPLAAPGLPSELLTRRPDIQTAEANLLAAHADLAAARTAFLPDITLTAAAGVAYPALATVIQFIPATGTSESIGASLTQAIFSGGRIEGRIAETKARQDELLAAYRASVIAAFSDVDNALSAFSHLADQEQALSDQVAHSEKVLAAAQRKYTSGYADFLVVTDAERLLYTARDQLSDIRRARLAASVALFKALGGGWTAPANPPA